jgi:hypothetical protein
VPDAFGEWVIAPAAAVFFAMTIVLFVVVGALLEGLPAL